MDKKEKILQVTLELITYNGFHGTPVSMIAEQAGVGSGTIYRYFENKEAIITELYNNVQQKLSDAIVEDVPQELSIKDEIYIKWKNILNFFLDNPLEASFLEQYTASPYISKAVLIENRKRYKHYDELIERAIENHIIKNVNYNTMTTFMWGTVRHLFALHTTKTARITEELVEEIFSVFWKGIAFE